MSNPELHRNLDRGPVILTFEEATAEKGCGCQSLATKAACQITNGRRGGSAKIVFEMGAQDREIPLRAGRTFFQSGTWWPDSRSLAMAALVLPTQILPPQNHGA
jgi:hypothetical protein